MCGMESGLRQLLLQTQNGDKKLEKVQCFFITLHHHWNNSDSCLTGHAESDIWGTTGEMGQGSGWLQLSFLTQAVDLCRACIFTPKCFCYICEFFSAASVLLHT